jgi:hypothetical protein
MRVTSLPKLTAGRIATFHASNGSYSILAHVADDLPINMFYVQGGEDLHLRGKWSGSGGCSAPYAISHQVIADTIVIALHTGALPPEPHDSLLSLCIGFGVQAAYQVSVRRLIPNRYLAYIYVVPATHQWAREAWGRPIQVSTVVVTRGRMP